MEKEKRLDTQQKIGWVFFGLFAFLIVAGIFVKRVMGHPEFMMFFHLPAAVFLALAGHKIAKRLRQQYRRDCEAEFQLWRQKNPTSYYGEH